MTAIALEQQRRDRNSGIVVTVVLHILLAILFLFIGLKQFDPPIQENSVEVAMADFGTTDDGGGNTPVPDPGGQPTTAPESGDPDDVATEENSDVEVVKPPTPKPNPKPVKKPTVVKPKEPVIDSRLSDALNNWNKPGQTPSDGPGKTPGDPGIPEGKPGGSGVMRGNGWEIRGSRGAVRGPDLSERPELSNETWVEVAIVIDREGNVKRTYVSNSATSDSKIQNVALRAVKNMLIVPNPTGPPEQVQYVRLTFRPS
ncbi:MAG: hypothetical protein IPI81_17215 [Flavobacteriales bacterium]|nr:hypothetical protein [Flavobacteriales bacterium]MCC6938783.1 hypothetical protein [Flavobacteriales bacterium]